MLISLEGCPLATVDPESPARDYAVSVRIS
jgi:hypothetical protein